MLGHPCCHLSRDSLIQTISIFPKIFIIMIIITFNNGVPPWRFQWDHHQFKTGYWNSRQESLFDSKLLIFCLHRYKKMGNDIGEAIMFFLMQCRRFLKRMSLLKFIYINIRQKYLKLRCNALIIINVSFSSWKNNLPLISNGKFLETFPTARESLLWTKCYVTSEKARISPRKAGMPNNINKWFWQFANTVKLWR